MPNKFMIFNGFWSQNGAQNLRGAAVALCPGPTSSKDGSKMASRPHFSCFWEPFWMFLEPMLKVLGLILALLISKRCQTHAKYFLLPPGIACLKTAGGRR